MVLDNSILSDVKEGIGLSSEPSPFDTEILMHINSAIGKLNQNGIGKTTVADRNTTWEDLQNPEQTEGNLYFKMIPLFITLSTKILFDPPPPSSVQYHSNAIDEILWRLRMSYQQ